MGAVAAKKSTAGFITNPKDHQRANSAGLATMKKKLNSLRALARGVEQSIRQADAAASQASFWDSVVFGAKVTLATCDGLVAVLGHMTGPAGSAWAAGYAEAKDLGDIGNKMYQGDDWGADVLKKGIQVTGAGTKHAIAKSGLDAQGKKILGNHVGAKQHGSTIFVDVVNQDQDGVIKQLKALGTEHLAKKLEKKGKERMAGIVSVGSELIDVSRALGGALAEFQNSRSDNTKYFAQMKKNILQQLAGIRGRIARLEKEIEKFEAQMAKEASANKPHVAPPPIKGIPKAPIGKPHIAPKPHLAAVKRP